MKKHSLIVLCLVGFMMAPACGDKTVTVELENLRSEVRDLKGQIAALRIEVEALKKSLPASSPGPCAPGLVNCVSGWVKQGIRPFPGCTLVVFDGDHNRVAQTLNDSTGKFCLKGPLSGKTYTVVCTPPPGSGRKVKKIEAVIPDDQCARVNFLYM